MQAKGVLKMQIEDSELETERGEVIAIGRLKIPKTKNFKHEIPMLSFIVIKKKDCSFVSTCIHLQMDGYGRTEKESLRDMINSVLYYLEQNFNNEKYRKTCWRNMLSLLQASKNSSAMWDRYHAFQIMLAERGLTTDFVHLQQKKIRVIAAKNSQASLELTQLRNENKELKIRVKELEEEKRERRGQEYRMSLIASAANIYRALPAQKPNYIECELKFNTGRLSHYVYR
jgi:hypothetical protein